MSKDFSLSTFLSLKESLFSNNYNLMLVVLERNSVATIDDLFDKEVDIFQPDDVIKTILSKNSLTGDNNVLYNTFMLRGNTTFKIPEIKSSHVKPITSYGTKFDNISYANPIFDNSGKVDFVIDRELNTLIALQTMSGASSSNNEFFINSLRSRQFSNKYIIYMIVGFYGRWDIFSNTLNYDIEKYKNFTFIFSDVKFIGGNIDFGFNVSSNNEFKYSAEFIFDRVFFKKRGLSA